MLDFPSVLQSRYKPPWTSGWALRLVKLRVFAFYAGCVDRYGPVPPYGTNLPGAPRELCRHASLPRVAMPSNKAPRLKVFPAADGVWPRGLTEALFNGSSMLTRPGARPMHNASSLDQFCRVSSFRSRCWSDLACNSCVVGATRAPWIGSGLRSASNVYTLLRL